MKTWDQKHTPTSNDRHNSVLWQLVLLRRTDVHMWFSYITLSVQTVAIVVFALAVSSSANAVNITVTSTAQSPGKTGDCTLGEAIRAANTDARVDACPAGSGADIITLPTGTYALDRADNNADGPNGLPSITSNITINGPGAATTDIETSVDPDNELRIFHIASTGTLTLNGLTISDSVLVDFDGGGIFNRGTLNITNSRIVGIENAVIGGGIFNSGGTVNVTNSVIRNTRAGAGGGIFNADGTIKITNSTIGPAIFAYGAGGAGVFNSGGTMDIIDSTIFNNEAEGGRGGGIFNERNGTVNIANSTISNTASDRGGGIFNDIGTISITNTTIANNNSVSLENVGAGIFNTNGTVSLLNSILADNTDGDGESSDCSGSVTSLGNNLIGDTAGCTITPLASDITGEDAGLGNLTDSAMPGKGHFPPLPTSLAIDAGNDAFCPRIDQRGQARICACDIGAVEFQPQRILSVPANDNSVLIQRITEANMEPSYDVINLEGDTYTLNAKADDTEGLNGLPSIKSKICIRSTGTSTTTIRRDPAPNTPAFRILHIAPQGALTLERLTIRGGLAADTTDVSVTGGGILNTGALTLLDSVVRNNRALFNGGGIENSARAILTRSTVRDNVADTFGGGVNNFVSATSTGMLSLTDTTVSGNDASDGGGIENSAKAVVMRSTISGNTTDGRGGGIANAGDKTELTLLNSTISTNMASSGGGIANFGAATLTSNNVTITKNTASEGTSGFLNEMGSTVNISNTIIAQNTGSDCEGSFNTPDRPGFNLVQNTSNCTIAGARNISGVDPLLDPLGLRNNGGPTQTQLLLSNSPAIDTGNSAAPGTVSGACEPLDQRGFSRPVDGDGRDGARCDIGAVEFGMRIVNNSFPEPTRTSPIPSANTSGCPSGFVGKLSFTASFTNTSSSPLRNLVVEVKELTNGNLLQDPGGGLGGTGARLAVPRAGGFSNGVLERNESVDVPFVICLRNRDRFDFFVDVLGQ